MQRDRRAILSLVAHGRITAAEAERLLILWNEAREGALIFTACIVLVLLTQFNLQQGLSTLMHFAHNLLAGDALHHALTLLTRFTGGLQ
ncbi:MAG: hypothetical protein ACLPY1_06445 [Terracidiphilus sp.]